VSNHRALRVGLLLAHIILFASVDVLRVQILRTGENDALCSADEMKRARENKNRPMEMSSTRAVGRFREVVEPVKKTTRDPRFESLCGHFDEAHFRSSHAFLFEDQLPAEKKRLMASIKKERNASKKEDLKAELVQVNQEIQRHADQKKHREQASNRKKLERDAVKKGKNPYFLTKTGSRKSELIEKYRQLKASGKLESFLAKRRKKNASKDHRYIPTKRRSAGTD